MGNDCHLCLGKIKSVISLTLEKHTARIWCPITSKRIYKSGTKSKKPLKSSIYWFHVYQVSIAIQLTVQLLLFSCHSTAATFLKIFSPWPRSVTADDPKWEEIQMVWKVIASIFVTRHSTQTNLGVAQASKSLQLDLDNDVYSLARVMR